MWMKIERNMTMDGGRWTVHGAWWIVDWLPIAGGSCLRKGPKVDTSSQTHGIEHHICVAENEFSGCRF